MVAIRVRVQPGASKDETVGWDGECLRIRLRGRAVEGQANRGLLAFLAKSLDLRPYQVTIVRGERARDKIVEIDLPTVDEVRNRLEVRNA